MATIGYEYTGKGKVIEKSFNEKWLGKYEAILSQGNGYLGIRAGTEESYSNETRNTFVSGTFNLADQSEVTELPNVPDISQIEIKVDGEVLNLNRGFVDDYHRQLELSNGELSRSFVWTLPSMKQVKFNFERIVSKTRRHVIAQRVTITPITEAVMIDVKSGIDGRQTNSGAQHFYEGQKRIHERQFIQMTSQTTESQIGMIVSTTNLLTVQAEVKEGMFIGRRQVSKEYQVGVNAHQELTIEKFSTVYTTRDKECQNLEINEIQEKSVAELKELRNLGYSKLADESTKQWDKDLWQQHSVDVTSENKWDQLAINFALYHLQVMTPFHDDRMNIGAKGLSGEGYKGHSFWDTEVFILPYFIFNYPDQAKNLLMHRYHGLAGAKKKASVNNYQGAMYPWESGWINDGETTPRYGEADIVTGEPVEILTGLIEHHITSDVALGFERYGEATGDQVFYQNFGQEVIIQTAIYWLSRVSFSTERGQYEILDVIGPDEYKEHVNNNAYTNYLAFWNIQRGLEISRESSTRKLFEEPNQSMTLQEFSERASDVLTNFYLPQINEEGILPQDDTYLNKKNTSIVEYKVAEKVGMIFKDYNLAQVNELQVSKQADVLLLMLLQKEKFTNQEIKKNWDYYEPRTLHDSSLSLSTHSVLASQLNQLDLAYDLFNESTLIDLGRNMDSSNEGIHSAAMGGIWQGVFHGFAGINVTAGKLTIDPKLPASWTKLKLSMYYQGQQLEIIIEKETMTITNVAEVELITFYSSNQKYQVKEVISVKREVSGS